MVRSRARAPFLEVFDGTDRRSSARMERQRRCLYAVVKGRLTSMRVLPPTLKDSDTNAPRNMVRKERTALLLI